MDSKEKLSWIDCHSTLPPMFENVIVWGRREKENVLLQAYQARRFGSGSDKNQPFQWLTPCDFVVEDVTHWTALPLQCPKQDNYGKPKPHEKNRTCISYQK